MKSSSVIRAFALAIGSLLCVAILGSMLPANNAFGEVLYTTQDDFTGWGGTGFIIGPQATPDTDGSTTNGTGNTTNAGGTGTGGSMSVDRDTATPFSYFYSPGEQGNAAFIDALGVSGDVLFDFTYPTDGNYFQLGLVLNYDGHFDQAFGGGPVDNGDGTFTQSVPYTFAPGDVSSYLQLGLIFNSDSTTPFAVDNIRVENVVHPVVPEPATMVLLSLGTLGSMLFWRRLRD